MMQPYNCWNEIRFKMDCWYQIRHVNSPNFQSRHKYGIKHCNEFYIPQMQYKNSNNPKKNIHSLWIWTLVHDNFNQYDRIGLCPKPIHQIWHVLSFSKFSYCTKSGNQPQANLANFGYMTNKEVENLEILLCWPATKTY